MGWDCDSGESGSDRCVVLLFVCVGGGGVVVVEGSCEIKNWSRRRGVEEGI